MIYKDALGHVCEPYSRQEYTSQFMERYLVKYGRAHDSSWSCPEDDSLSSSYSDEDESDVSYSS